MIIYRFNVSEEYADTLENINLSLNLGAEELRAGEDLDAVMAGAIQESAKAITPSSKKRRERKTIDDEEWAKKLAEEEEGGEEEEGEEKRKKRRRRKRRMFATAAEKEAEEEEEKEEEKEEKEEKELVVEKITGEAVDEDTGKVYYHVKWAGYSYGQSTWEPLTNLGNCLEALNTYLANKYKKDARVTKIKFN